MLTIFIKTHSVTDPQKLRQLLIRKINKLEGGERKKPYICGDAAPKL
jgi:hypothetical protein